MHAPLPPETLIRTTTALCRRCNDSHPAKVVVKNGNVVGVTHCPKGDEEVMISSNPDLYLELTQRSPTRPEEPPPENLKFVLNYLSITNACNFQCTVCGTNAGGPDKHTYLSLDEICKRAGRAYDEGARILHLFGGEPTLHKEIFTIIQRLTDMGLSVGLVTNGYRLGRDPDYAAKLKAHGLQRVCLQFDSLDCESLCILSRDYLDEKKLAIRHALDSGMDLGLNCTVTRRTLNELVALVDHGISLGAGVRNMTFGCAAPVGRFLISKDNTVDREQIVAALTKNGDNPYFELDDVLPLPAFLPLGMQVHPDCGVHILLLRNPKGAVPLNRFVDLRHLYARLGTIKSSTGFGARRLRPLLEFCRCLRMKRLPGFLKWLVPSLCKRKEYGMLNIGITDYRAAEFLDEQRLGRCASAFHTSAGPIRSCLHFYQRSDIPGTLEYEAEHQSC